MFNMRNCSLKMGASRVCSVFQTNLQPLKHLVGANQQQHRLISRTNLVTAKQGNYYVVLNVAKTATQDEVKTAYYSLSKMYHPDTNKDSEDAAQKFLQITEAYEVLGNVKARKSYDIENDMYDKLGYGPGMESEFGETVDDEEEDDAQTRFYRQHMRRSEVPIMTHRPDARKFDEWVSRHTSKGFRRK